MIKIHNKLRCKVDFNKFDYQGDLETEQGGLLGYFTSNQFGYNSEYLFSCVDNTSYMNRWLVLGIDEQTFVNYLCNGYTLLELFSLATVHIIDLGKNNKLVNSYCFKNNDIKDKYFPKKYLPHPISFLKLEDSPYKEILLKKLLEKTEYDYFKKEYPEFDQNIESVRVIIKNDNKKTELKMTSSEFISHLKWVIYKKYHDWFDNKEITIKYLDGTYGIFEWVYSQGDKLIINKFIPF